MSSLVPSIPSCAPSITQRSAEKSPTSTSRSVGRRNVAFGQADRTLELRVETLISIWFIAHRPSKSSPAALSQLGKTYSRHRPANTGTLDLDFAAVETDLALRSPPRCALRCSPLSWRSPQAATTSSSIISVSASTPAARQKRSELGDMPQVLRSSAHTWESQWM